MVRSLQSHTDDRPLKQSRELTERASKVIPGATQTASKGPTQFVQGVSPTHIQRAQGSHVWDADGSEYIDCVMALGPVLLGHNYPAVTEAVTEQLTDGTMYTMEHPLHVEVAELLTEVIPCAEMVRFAKNGNDVTTLAAKVARAHTDRNVIATQGYHGWTDVWMGDHPNLNRGVPEAVGKHTERFEYNDIESLERIFDENPGDVAAIVTTPVNLDAPEDDFLEQLREIADREGAVLVFDEILTGFRFSLGGAQQYFGVEPDLACFAKGMANGYPISALVGRSDVMSTISDSDFVYSMTYAGEALSLAATKAAIEVQQRENVHEHIFEQGSKLVEGYDELASEYGLEGVTGVNGFSPRFKMWFRDEDGNADRLAKSLFMQEAHKRGVLFTDGHLPSYSHSDEDVEIMLSVYRDCMEILADAVKEDAVEDYLEGEPVGATLRERTGEDRS
ncbi:aspartate aminotransferase family protein [Haloprofundus salinisoli]|uniref:aspartate aminotransferase family protein n=1 Tax=Haloprofundus salinisoli TaxID=2876193 RepID=UPI001CCF95DC|nr:aminotransferase class III-fold pyridoxal phosphate-dependent enzyme [Haloprofundus salinisoli]